MGCFQEKNKTKNHCNIAQTHTEQREREWLIISQLMRCMDPKKVSLIAEPYALSLCLGRCQYFDNDWKLCTCVLTNIHSCVCACEREYGVGIWILFSSLTPDWEAWGSAVIATSRPHRQLWCFHCSHTHCSKHRHMSTDTHNHTATP